MHVACCLTRACSTASLTYSTDAYELSIMSLIVCSYIVETVVLLLHQVVNCGHCNLLRTMDRDQLNSRFHGRDIFREIGLLS